jgi:hypothetical protein
MRIERVVLEHHRHPPLGGQFVGDVGAADQGLAAGHFLEPGDHPQQRGLAAARRPQKGGEGAVVDGQIEALDHLERAVPLGDVLQFNGCHWSAP